MRSDWHQRKGVSAWAGTVLGCVAGLLVLVAPTSAAELRLGTAAVKITPPDGTPIAGPAVARDSEGVLDDVYAKAAVLDDGKTKIALVVCDLSGVPVGIVFESRRIIAEKTGIPADHVMISATHTHTGPSPFGSGPYVKQLPPWIAQAVQQANDRLTATKNLLRIRERAGYILHSAILDEGRNHRMEPRQVESEYPPTHRNHRSAGERDLCRDGRQESAADLCELRQSPGHHGRNADLGRFSRHPRAATRRLPGTGNADHFRQRGMRKRQPYQRPLGRTANQPGGGQTVGHHPGRRRVEILWGHEGSGRRCSSCALQNGPTAVGEAYGRGTPPCP